MKDEMNELARLSDGGVMLDPGRMQYWIDLNRCDSHEKIVWWVKHLAAKPWVTGRMLKRFIALACAENNLTLPSGT